MGDKVSYDKMVSYVEKLWSMRGETLENTSHHDCLCYDAIRSSLLRLKGYEGRAREIMGDVDIEGKTYRLIRDIAEGRDK